MTRLAPLVERTDNSSHQYSCVDRAHEPDDIEAALRRQPAQTCPSARQESPPLPAEDHFLVALDRGLSVFDKPARLARSACGSLPPSSRAVRVAVRVHRREVSRTRCGRCGFTASRTSSRWSQPEALSGLPSLCVPTSSAWPRIAASPRDVIGRKKVAFPTVGSQHPNAFRA